VQGVQRGINSPRIEHTVPLAWAGQVEWLEQSLRSGRSQFTSIAIQKIIRSGCLRRQCDRGRCGPACSHAGACERRRYRSTGLPRHDRRPANEAIVISSTGPKVSGWSRHGAPERRTQKMPPSTRRSFTRRTPRGLFANIGLMAVHSADSGKPSTRRICGFATRAPVRSARFVASRFHLDVVDCARSATIPVRR